MTGSTSVEPYDLKVKILRTDENTRYHGLDAGEGLEMLESANFKINDEGSDESTGWKESRKGE